ncbi:MAG: HAD family hydrolase [Candidatus Woesearchaeota archaeon]
MIKLIIFDLWSTLQYKRRRRGAIAWFWRRIANKHPYRKVLKAYERIFQLDKSDDYVKKYYELFSELELKKDEKLIRKVAKYRKDIEKCGTLYKYAIPLMRKLKKKGYKIAVLSNITHLQGKKVRSTVLKKYANHFFFSYNIGTIKPNVNNYKTVLKFFKVKPKEAVMIGDNYKDDYKGSKKAGLNAIHFKNGRQLNRDLKRMGVL